MDKKEVTSEITDKDVKKVTTADEAKNFGEEFADEFFADGKGE